MDKKDVKDEIEKEVKVQKATKTRVEPPDTNKAPPKKTTKRSPNTNKVDENKAKKATSNSTLKKTSEKKVETKLENKKTEVSEKEEKQLITKIDEPKKEKMTFKNKCKELWAQYTLYEKIWFITITIASLVIGFLFPEEDTNGVNGWVIMGLYLSNIFLNVLCELMLAKQDKWNFIISLAVEISEIALCLVLKTMFISFLSIIIFWIPVDIMSFISWRKHKDEEQDELTIVRELNKKQKILFALALIVWTIGLGYLSAKYSPDSDAYSSILNLRTIAYLDAAESALGIANGLFIMFRFKEQWSTWIAETVLEAAMNILLGQWVLLVLKVGYLTNSYYGYAKWSKYIKNRDTDLENSDNSNSKIDKDTLNNQAIPITN